MPALFFYAKYGAVVSFLPQPAVILGPVATTTLSDATTATLLTVANSLLLGPLLVAGFAVLMNYLLTHPEVREIPGTPADPARAGPDPYREPECRARDGVLPARCRRGLRIARRRPLNADSGLERVKDRTRGRVACAPLDPAFSTRISHDTAVRQRQQNRSV